MIILIFTPACILLGRIVFVMYICHQYLILLVSLSFTLTFSMTYFPKFSSQISFMQERTLDDCNWYFIFMIVIMIVFMSHLSKGRHIDFVDFLILFIRVFRFHIVILRFFLLFYVFFLFLAFLERYFSEIFDCFAPNFHDLLSFIVATD